MILNHHKPPYRTNNCTESTHTDPSGHHVLGTAKHAQHAATPFPRKANAARIKKMPQLLIAALSVCLLVPTAAYSTQSTPAFAEPVSTVQSNTSDNSASKEDGISSANATPVERSAHPSLPAEKTQVVYIDGDAYGTQKGVYVVNTFQTDREVDVRDSGNYSSVENLTDSQPLSQDALSFTVPAQNDFVYRGTMDPATATPWNVNVQYRLDGKEVSAEELSGASGALEMTLNISPNASYAGNYADNYLLQVTGALDTATTHDLSAESATIAQSGDDTQLSYMLFPDQSASYTITAHVDDFSFAGWQIAGVPLSIALNIDDDAFGDTTTQFDELSSAIAAANNGANQVSTGAEELDAGLQALTNQNQALADGGNQLNSALGSLEQGTTELADTISNSVVSGIEKLAAGSTDYVSGLTKNSQEYTNAADAIDTDAAESAYQTALQTYTQSYASAYSRAFTVAYASYIQDGLEPDKATQRAGQDAASAALKDPDFTSAKQSLLKASQNVTTAYATKQGNQSAADALTSALESYNDIHNGLQSMVDENSNSSIYALEQGAQELAEGSNAAASGAQTFQQGVNSYSSAADSTAAGANALATGSSNLTQGTQELADQTSGLSDQVSDQIRDKLTEFLNPSFQMTDFANGSTKQITRVQFVYMTDAI